ncbi:MAG: hypothetical protein IT158_13005 [Bryobacterales bacterium]|nr:hypothetical protein [Bryobacterales bacterium]
MFHSLKNLRMLAPAAAIAVGMVQPSAAQQKEFLSLKAYAEYADALNFVTTFNYAGQPVWAQESGTGSIRVVFEGLADLAYDPVVHVTPRQTGAGPDTCSAALEPNGSHLIAEVKCRKAGALVSPRFSLMIADATSDAPFASVAECSGCTAPGPSHNPWSRITAEETLYVIQRPSAGRTRVYFRVDSPLTTDTNNTLPFVTPAVNNRRCQVAGPIAGDFGTGTYRGAEVHCTDLAGTPAWAPFYLLIVPETFETAWAQVQANGKLFPSRFYNSEFGRVSTGFEVSRKSVGRYRIRFRTVGSKWSDGGAVKVSSVGTSGASCALESTQVHLGDQITDLRCMHPDGSLIDSAFTAVVSSRN